MSLSKGLGGRTAGIRFFDRLWTPVPVPDSDPGFAPDPDPAFAGVTSYVTFYENIKVESDNF